MARNHRSRALLLPVLLAACLRGDAGGPRGAGLAAPLADASGPAALDPAAGTLDTDERDATASPPTEDSADAAAPTAITDRPPAVPADRDHIDPPPRQHHLPDLLGARRARVGERTGEPGVDADAGWVSHGPDLTIRYEGDRAVEIAARVPAALECWEAARWLGFSAAMAPLRRDDRCLWPGVSERHRLAEGLAAEHIHAAATFHVWRSAKPRARRR